MTISFPSLHLSRACYIAGFMLFMLVIVAIAAFLLLVHLFATPLDVLWYRALRNVIMPTLD